MKETLLIIACFMCEIPPEKSEADILLERAVERCLLAKASQKADTVLRCWNKEMNKIRKKQDKIIKDNLDQVDKLGRNETNRGIEK